MVKNVISCLMSVILLTSVSVKVNLAENQHCNEHKPLNQIFSDAPSHL